MKHQAKIQEYLAEMNRLAENLDGEALDKIHSMMVRMKYVMCCAYKEYVLPPFKVQSSKFRANPEKYCRIADERNVVVHGDTDDSLRMSFGYCNPLESPIDSELCEICLNES